MLIFSPLSYPAIIDDYSTCLDDNLLMKYNIYVGIFIVVVLAVIMAIIYAGLWYFDWAESFLGKFFGGCTILIVTMLLVISVWVTYSINSIISLLITVIETAVAVFTLYEDYMHSYINGKEILC